MKRGFSLIELVVVIGIIGLLTVTSIVGLTNQQKRSRDARRIADMGSVAIALENYRGLKNSYPKSCDSVASCGNAGAYFVVLDNSHNEVTKLVTEGLLNTLPRDPKPAATGTQKFCTNYAYLSGSADIAWDGTPGDTAFLTPNQVDSRQWTLTFGSELQGDGSKHHPLDASTPDNSGIGDCGSTRFQGLTLGPL